MRLPKFHHPSGNASLETALVLPCILFLVTAILFLFTHMAVQEHETPSCRYMETIRLCDEIKRKAENLLGILE